MTDVKFLVNLFDGRCRMWFMLDNLWQQHTRTQNHLFMRKIMRRACDRHPAFREMLTAEHVRARAANYARDVIEFHFASLETAYEFCDTVNAYFKRASLLKKTHQPGANCLIVKPLDPRRTKK